MANIDKNALYNIGYGLYVVTTHDGVKDNGLIVNSVMQLTSTPLTVAVSISKENYSYEVIKNSKILNVNCLTESTPFELFKHYGFQSGKTVNKFENSTFPRTENGLIYLTENVNSVMSLKVTDLIDLGTHGMFICSVEEAKTFNNNPSVTYAYYHKNIKPGVKKQSISGWVCKICGYLHNDEILPDDFICPICKHGASDFEKL
ncbi:MAG: flavin reductase [Clostridia bacterium]|nr:flavin reductase [Clostridia bacterium]